MLGRYSVNLGQHVPPSVSSASQLPPEFEEKKKRELALKEQDPRKVRSGSYSIMINSPRNIDTSQNVHIKSKVKYEDSYIEFDIPLSDMLKPWRPRGVIMAIGPRLNRYPYRVEVGRAKKRGTVTVSGKGSTYTIPYYYGDAPDNHRVDPVTRSLRNMFNRYTSEPKISWDKVPYLSYLRGCIELMQTGCLTAGKTAKRNRGGGWYTFMEQPLPSDIKTTLNEFYTLSKSDIQNLVNQGLSLEDANKYINNIAEIQAQFPIKKAIRWWKSYVFKGLKNIIDITKARMTPYNIISPFIYSIGESTSVEDYHLNGSYIMMYEDILAMASKNKGKLQASKDEFKDIIRTIRDSIIRIENRCLDIDKAMYYIQGGTPINFVFTSMNRYNNYVKSQQEKRNKLNPMEVIATVFTAIPGPLMGFGLAMQGAMQYSNLKRIKAQKKDIEAQKKRMKKKKETVKEITGEVAEDMAVQETKDIELIKQKMKKWGLITGGAAVAGLALMELFD